MDPKDTIDPFAKYGAKADEDPFAKYGAKADEPEAPAPIQAAQTSISQAFNAPSAKPESSFGETLARKGLGAATAVTEIVPVATQAVAGLRSAFGDRTYEDELARVREEQQMMRKLEPATTGITRGAGNVALSVPAVALGGPLGLAALTGAQALSRGAGVGQAALEAGVGGLAGPVLSRAPAVIQAATPVVATGAAALGANDQSALWEAITGLAPAAAAAISQGVRGAYRGLVGRAEKASEQVFSEQGAKFAGLKEKDITEARRAVSSAQGERRALTGEQQTRGSKILDLLRLGKKAGMTDLPSEESLLTADGGWSPEALEEFKKAVRSFIVNSPEKFTSEPKRIAAALEEALAAEAATLDKWSDPEAVAQSLISQGPVAPAEVPFDLKRAVELLRQDEIAKARARVPEEIKSSAKFGALIGATGAAPSYLSGQRAIPLASVAGAGGVFAGRKIKQLLATDPKTKLFKDPAAANVIYDFIPSVVRKFPTLAKYASLATDKGIRARPVFLLEALRRDPDFARAVEEEVTGEVTPE
jgi:hypothetical protein